MPFCVFARSSSPPTNNRRRVGFTSSVPYFAPLLSSSRGNFLPLPPFGGGVVRPVSPVLRPKQRFEVAEVVVAVGDFSNTRHSNILRIDDFGTAPLASAICNESIFRSEWQRKRSEIPNICLLSKSLSARCYYKGLSFHGTLNAQSHSTLYPKEAVYLSCDMMSSGEVRSYALLTIDLVQYQT